jgi:hypothetical protein
MNIPDHSFIKSDDLMTRHIAGETLIVPVRSQVGDLNAIYTLNEVGTKVWQMIDASTPVTRIVEAITAEYDVTQEEAATDVIELLGSMQSAGLIRHAGGSE